MLEFCPHLYVYDDEMLFCVNIFIGFYKKRLRRLFGNKIFTINVTLIKLGFRIAVNAFK